jgi:hypothetical protein
VSPSTVTDKMTERRNDIAHHHRDRLADVLTHPLPMS